MKSLDEVIKKIEKQWVCPSSDEADEYCELYEVRDDVLHYLKEYRDDRENFSEAISNCGKALNKYIMDIHTLAQQEENLPLTWDELKQMKGKPVWMEADGGKYKNWFIVGNFFSWFAKEDFDAHVNLYRDGSAMEMSKEVYGSHWQAYRKERE